MRKRNNITVENPLRAIDYGSHSFSFINFYKHSATELSNYRGLYRGSFGDWDVTGSSKKLVTDFMNLGREGSNIPYSEKNLEAAITVYRIFIEQGLNPDFIVISNSGFQDPRFEFLGYDVCAKSLYYSPIGSGGITGERAYLLKHLDQEMKEELLNDLNEHKLLTTEAIALRFAKFCTDNSELIESETPWFPVKVFGYRV
jgi:hypothetical protein